MGIHNRQKRPMPRGQWKRIRAIRLGVGNYIHVSAEAKMILDPQAALFAPTRYIPWIQKPGVTYDIGRNKAKRAARAAS